MEKRYILALDEGTTSARSLLYDTVKNEIVAVQKKPIKQIYPKPGWVEHDAREIWQVQSSTLFEVASKAEPEEIFGIGITNQRETVVVWDKDTGEPVCNAIVWQCRRTAEYCAKLCKDKALVDTVHKKTGLIIDAYFSATKIKWILENVPVCKELLKEDRLLTGTIDTYLIWKLTKGASFVTDTSNASRTMLFNINALDWDDDLLALFKIPRKILPAIVPSSGICGTTRILGVPIEIAGIAGDQQASLFGQACTEPGDIKNTYGTGCFMLINTGNKPRFSKNRLLTTIAWTIGKETVYALEGSVFNGGSSVQWLRDEMGLIATSAESEDYAKKVKNTNGVYFVPAFTGLGAPWWDSGARGMFTGITRGANKNHLIRAVLEGIAFSSRDVFNLIQEETKLLIPSLYVDGGASENDLLMQFQSDILGIPVERAKNMETTAFGAILLAGLATGAYKSISEIVSKVKRERVFKPKMSERERKGLYDGWISAVKRALS